MRIRQQYNGMTRFQNNSPGNDPANYKNRSDHETRTPQNSKTTTVIHGEYPSPNKIHH